MAHITSSVGLPEVLLVVKNPLPMQEPQERRVQSQHQEDPLEEGLTTLSSILAWRIPWTEECVRLQFIGSQSWI